MTVSRRAFVLSSAVTLSASCQAAQTVDAPRRGLWTPKLSENLADVNADSLRWLKQLGCDHVIFQAVFVEGRAAPRPLNQ